MARKGIMEILPGIHLIREEYVNMYLLHLENKLILIDTGLTGEPIINYLESLNLRPEDLDLIIITHHHLDHTGGLKVLHKHTNAKIASHKDEAQLIEKRTGIKPTILLEHSQQIEGLLVIHTPGHTPGHIALLLENKNSLFVGDLVYEENGSLHEIPQRYSMDPQANRLAIKSLLAYNFNHILPSHGRPLLGNGREKVEELVRELKLR